MYDVVVVAPFKDITNDNKLRRVGDKYTITDDARLLLLMGENKLKKKFVRLEYAHKKCGNIYKGKEIVIHQGYLYFIGGIETFLFNLAKQYQDRNIKIICKQVDPTQLVHLAKYVDIQMDDEKIIHTDIMILGNYDGHKILHRVKANTIYQMIHADLQGMAEVMNWKDFRWKKDNRIKEVICVSEVAAKGLEAVSGYKPKVIYNILDDAYEEENGITFITLSRATPEKGINRILEMVHRFRAADKKFIWFMCCSLSQIKDNKILKEIKNTPELVIVPPSVYNKMLIRNCDYLVQLSDTESFCYSAFEALQRGVPVILTDFPEAYNIIDDGENGYILKKDLSNLDIDKIFNHKPTNLYYIDRCNKDDWEKVFIGEF